ncbi:MAG TPA: DUF6152 family protein [Terriglobia bacterium]|nr:DUF6152 family protein [Terriglobia bacterium]
MRNRLRKAAIILCLVLAGSSVASAHHSFCSGLDSSKPFLLTGKVARIELRNPHSYLFLDVKNANGTVEQWVLHVVAVSSMRSGLWNKDTLKAGDEVTVRGFPAKGSDEKRGGLSEVVFKGKTLFEGIARNC